MTASMFVPLSSTPGPARRAEASAPLDRIRAVQMAERMPLEASRSGRRSLGDVCASIGMSEGAPRKAFAVVRGDSPGRHLRSRQLAQVRDALLAAPDRPSAVKQAATSHGFFHLGRFARAYREHFGELPSETVARARHGASPAARWESGAA
jgi:AraC-like DNA-binding protein